MQIEETTTLTCLNPTRMFLLEQIRFDKTIVRAKGHYLYDEAGRAYLDFMAQYGAIPFGYNPDFLWRCLDEVRRRHEPSFVQPLISPGAEALAAELIAVAPGQLRHVTFTNSGAESVEAAIKIARAATSRPTILSTASGFHGKTLGAVSATGPACYRDPFLVDTSCFEHIPFDDLESLDARLSKRNVAAFIVEAVQGEGGMITPSTGYLPAALEICRRHGTLFVLDEVQTGLGRTGRLFASEHEALDPDVLLLAKALGGGLVPLGACLCTEKVWTRSFGYFHSSTFANNHLTCSVGLASLRHLLAADGGLVRAVREKGEYLRGGLQALVKRHPRAFVDTNGMGLMQSVQLAPWSGDQSYYLSHASTSGFAAPLVCGHLLNEHGILTAPAFNNRLAIRIEPALTISDAEIDRLLAALDATGDLIDREDHATLLSYLIGGKSARMVKSSGARIDFSATPSTPSATPSATTPAATLRDAGRCLGRYAFLIHPTSSEDIIQSSISPSFAQYDEHQIAAWEQYLAGFSAKCYEPGIAYHMPTLRSKAGGYVEGWLISCGLTPGQMIRLNRRDRDDLLSKYLGVARSLDVNMVGLGAFTSIITRGGVDVADCGLNLTTGNSLTAKAAVESLKIVALERDKALASATVGVIGSMGSVGRLTSKLLASVCARLVLFGNPANPAARKTFEVLAGELYLEALHRLWQGDTRGIAGPLRKCFATRDRFPEAMFSTLDDDGLRAFARLVIGELTRVGEPLPVFFSVDLEQHLPCVDAVISATNQSEAFIDSRLLASGTIVCDVARPPAIRSAVRPRKDIFVYAGGLMVLPDPVRFGTRNILGFPDGINLACLSECIALAMAGATRHYSLGNRISLAEADEVYSFACQHGFEVSIEPMDDEPERALLALDAGRARGATEVSG